MLGSIPAGAKGKKNQMNDEDIIKEVNSWKESELNLKHSRRMAIWKFVKFPILMLLLVTTVLSTIYFIGILSEPVRKRNYEQREENKRIQNELLILKEKSWIECVEAIGLEKCDSIRKVEYKEGWCDALKKYRNSTDSEKYNCI